MDKARTMKEIADLAGVSVATVSRVINHNGRFSKETEERVMKIIEENNYSINMTAKGLRTSRLTSVGIVVPDITNPHFAQLVLNIQMDLFENGYLSIICNTNEQTELEDSHIAALKAQNVCGMILISSRRYHKSLRKFPVVYVDRPARGSNKDDIMIESDNESGGFLATQQLIHSGCRKIAILKTHLVDMNQQIRYEGYRRALAEYHIDEEACPLFNIDEMSIPAAYSRIAEEIEKGTEFDGLMTTADLLATGAYTALRDKKVRVPEEIRLTGFDDSQIAFACGFSSVHQDTREMARLSVELLLRQLQGKPIATRHFYLPVSVTVRGSTTSKGVLVSE